MIVICPICKKALGCDDEASCVEPAPSHKHKGCTCPGTGQLGFVLVYDVDDKPEDYVHTTPKSDERYRNFKRKSKPEESDEDD